MTYKKRLEKTLWSIAYDVLDDIVCPIAKIGKPIANIYLASIDNHTLDEKQNNKILNKIQQKYKLSNEVMYDISAHRPLIIVALIIFLSTSIPLIGE